MKVSIIIKAYNEEQNISKAIDSALRSIKGMSGEVIVADSISSDKTVAISKKFPIKIVQIKNPKERSCGMGAELGYQFSRGDFIYILDGDMVLEPGFIKAAMGEFKKDKWLAGVGGIIQEMTDANIVFKRRITSEASSLENPIYTSRLMMGGLYSRDAVEKAGYFSNQFLHAYEESDLGFRLIKKGYKLKRIPVKMVKHFGDRTTSFQIITNRWKSRYLWGCGEFLRSNIFKPTFVNVLNELKIYIGVLIWWLSLFFGIILSIIFPVYLKLQLIATVLFLILFFIKKKNLSEFLFSMFSWNITSLGLVFGFIHYNGDPLKKIEAIRIK